MRLERVPGSHVRRVTKKWWAVTEFGVNLVTGYACQDPEMWWCPEAGYTLTEGHHLFKTKPEALRAAISETNDRIRDLQNHLKALENSLVNNC